MVYINKFGLPITDKIEIIKDVLDNNLSLQKNSIPISKGIGIFNTSFAEFNTTSKDLLEIGITNFIENNEYLSGNVRLDSEIEIKDRLLKITVKVNDEGIEDTKELIFEQSF